MQSPGPSPPGSVTGTVDCAFPMDFKINITFGLRVRADRADTQHRARQARARADPQPQRTEGTTAAAYIAAATEGRRVASSFGRSGYARLHSG